MNEKDLSAMEADKKNEKHMEAIRARIASTRAAIKRLEEKRGKENEKG